MIKPKPNIIVPFDDKTRFKNLVFEVINDSWIYQYTPDSISLDGDLFTLVFNDKKLVYEEVKVDASSDYIDVFLQGIKKPSDQYSVIDNGSDIIIKFTESITLRPADINAADFYIKGKIVNR